MTKVIIVLIFLVFPAVVIAGDYGAGQMEPLPYERLARPNSLSAGCSNVEIIEWRTTPSHTNSTKYSKKGVETVDITCNVVIDNFYKFILSQGNYKGINYIKLDTSLSFMPADMYRYGAEPRNLNDLKYRFVNRDLRYPLWGYYHRETNWTFIMNDVFMEDGETINHKFIVVTAHELFHAISYMSGAYYKHSPQSNRDNIDEEFAQQFTEYLGLGR